MKRLYLHNHWLAQLRRLAKKAEIYNIGEDQPMTEQQIAELFTRNNTLNGFRSGLTPEEYLVETLEFWMEGAE